MNVKELNEGDLIEFAGGWRARVSEKIRSDVIFVEAQCDCPYRHHAFGLEHPIWATARLIRQRQPTGIS